MNNDTSYHRRFRECGSDVIVEPGVWIEHPENFVVGDRVRIRRGTTVIGNQEEVRLGSDVSIYPNLFIQGTGRLIVGNNVIFYPNNYFSLYGEGSFIQVGSHTHFAPACVLYGVHGLTIGDYCALSANVVMATVGHDPGTKGNIVESSCGGPITMKNNSWVGANATILAHVTIGEGTIVGAGSVLTKDAEPNSIYLGAPARKVGTRG